MKLPWNKKYLVISFHVIFTVIVIYVLSLFLGNVREYIGYFREFFNVTLSVLSPLIIAIVISYLADPTVRFFEKRIGKIKFNSKNDKIRDNKRLFATLITFVLIFLIIWIGIKFVVNKFGSANIDTISDSINEYIAGFGDLLMMLKIKLADAGILKYVSGNIDNLVVGLTNWATASLTTIFSSVSKAGNIVLNVVIGLTVSFYFLKEKAKILKGCKDAIDVFFDGRRASKVKIALSEINGIFSGYISGQFMDAFIMAVLISVTFSFLGIKYAVLIGIISGFSNLIPYIGAIVAFILSVIMGFLSGTPATALYAAISVIVLQQIDSIIIVPKVVGKSVELHPVLVILSLAFFGTLFGIVGMVFAVPITAVIKMFILKYYNKKKNLKLRDNE